MTSTSCARTLGPEATVEFEGQRSRVLLEQLQAIDPERCLGRYVGRVSAEQQQTINHALTSKWVTPPATLGHATTAGLRSSSFTDPPLRPEVGDRRDTMIAIWAGLVAIRATGAAETAIIRLVAISGQCCKVLQAGGEHDAVRFRNPPITTTSTAEPRRAPTRSRAQRRAKDCGSAPVRSRTNRRAYSTSATRLSRVRTTMWIDPGTFST